MIKKKNQKIYFFKSKKILLRCFDNDLPSDPNEEGDLIESLEDFKKVFN